MVKRPAKACSFNLRFRKAGKTALPELCLIWFPSFGKSLYGETPFYYALKWPCLQPLHLINHKE
jgi:hypothetical protein